MSAVSADNEGMGTTVQHDGEFALTSDGKKYFGEIPAENGLTAGKIVLRIGRHTGEKGAKGDYGEQHIERADRLRQLKQNGFNNARELVEFVTSNFIAVYEGKGSGLILARPIQNKSGIVYVVLEFNNNSVFYDVTSALVAKKGYLKNKKPLWENPDSGFNSDTMGATTPPHPDSAPHSPTLDNALLSDIPASLSTPTLV
jgi:hypothetical protein